MRRMLMVSGVVLGVAALAACSSSGSSGGGSSTGGGGLAKDATGGGGYAAAAPSPVHRAAPVPAGVPAARDDAPLALGASKIVTATMTVAVKGAANVAKRANKAEDIVAAVGGEVDSDDRMNGKRATATLRLLVPPDSLRPVMLQLSRLGLEKSRTGSTKDVTTRVADVSSRVASAEGAIGRLRKLYGQATKVSDVIAIESELSSREANLEALQAEQRSLATKTAMATITLQLVTAPKPPPPPVKKHHDHHRGGFLGGLDRGWDAFRTAATWVATAVGAVLPFLLLALVIALGVRLLWPRLRRPLAAPAVPSGPSE